MTLNNSQNNDGIKMPDLPKRLKTINGNGNGNGLSKFLI